MCYLFHHYFSSKDFDIFPFFNSLTSLSHELFVYLPYMAMRLLDGIVEDIDVREWKNGKV